MPCHKRQQREEEKADFEQEVERETEERIFIQSAEDATTGVFALMTVVQTTKTRSGQDYRKLNEYVSCHSGGDMIYESDECGRIIGGWDSMRPPIS